MFWKCALWLHADSSVVAKPTLCIFKETPDTNTECIPIFIIGEHKTCVYVGNSVPIRAIIFENTFGNAVRSDRTNKSQISGVEIGVGTSQRKIYWVNWYKHKCLLSVTSKTKNLPAYFMHFKAFNVKMLVDGRNSYLSTWHPQSAGFAYFCRNSATRVAASI